MACERRLVPRLEAHGAHPGAVQRLGRVGEAPQLAVLLAEALDHAHTADRFVDHARDLARPLQRVPLRREHDPSQTQGHEQQRRHDGEHDEREQRREHEHHDQREHEQHDVAGGEGQEAEQRLDEREVGARARHDLAGRELVVVREVESLHAFEDRGAQVVLHVEREPSADEATDVREHEVHRAEAHEQCEERPERRAVGDDHVVDDRALDQRDGNGDECGAERHAERDEDLPAVPRQERPELAGSSSLAPALRRVGALAARRSDRRSSSPLRRAASALDAAAGSSRRPSTSSSRARIAASAAPSALPAARGDGEPVVTLRSSPTTPAPRGRAPPACRRSRTPWAWPARAARRGGWPGRPRWRSWPGAGTGPG